MTAAPTVDRRFYAWEVGIVLALSLGRSAVYAVLQLAERLSIAPLADQTATVQRSRSRDEFYDFSFQVLDSLFALAPVVLVLYLVFLHGGNPFRRWGLDFRRAGQDWAWGAGLFALIGLGTLGVYLAGRSLGLTAQIIPADVTEYWWSTPVLLLAALRHSLLEEIIMIAYLFDRARRIWPQLTDSPAAVAVLVFATALLRGAYHLYQGFGPGLGNALMGVIFAAVYLKYGRVMPLVIAHFLLDAVAFLAFPLVLQVFGLSSV
ncbi:CPBP family intramembrane glutamic endopeptidase [Nesterenkonia natronophila]|uniref:CPBP family intramembrane metalloprotease n=1 Tax=Nesterenkonia natronophila TaxID=2174932 RepID=A0A3A4FCV6_9MICC|nr:CPBP family intramembrane glutamic endopeptidase [Nesterenkonia natronophila]RJN32917.1 CPBP family intramembrane metalloprotease [Nesterenkonia natronophila]